MSVECMVCRGLPIFIIFEPKHRLLVHVFVRTKAVLTSTHNLRFEQNKKKKIHQKYVFFTALKLLFIAWACFRYVHLFIFTSAIVN